MYGARLFAITLNLASVGGSRWNASQPALRPMVYDVVAHVEQLASIQSRMRGLTDRFKRPAGA